MKEAIGWKETKEVPHNIQKYFPNLKKEPESFIKDEWERSDNRSNLNNRLEKLYPLKEPNVNPPIHPPVVDASLMCLVRNITLPIEDAVTFRDVLDRKIDLDLKKAYCTAGGASKPAVAAAAAVGQAISGWSANIEKSMCEGADQEKIISALHELKLAGDFVEASVDIRSSARAMLASVMARRALWLKPWVVDTASKTNWCKTPYDGVNLFGSKLDSAISTVTGGKSELIPSDRRTKSQKGPSFRRNLPER